MPLILFISFSTYYENKLKNISIEYNKSRGELAENTGKIVLEKVNETTQLKEIFQKDKEFLEKRYYDLNIENEELKIENAKLQAELDSVRGELEDTKTKFEKLQSQFQQVQNSLITANEQISRLIARVNELCRKLKDSGSFDDKC